MSLCLFGVCIPYSMMWPAVVLFLKPLFELILKYFSPRNGKSGLNEKLNSSPIPDSSTDVNFISESKPTELGIDCTLATGANEEEMVNSQVIRYTVPKGKVYNIESIEAFSYILQSFDNIIIKFTAEWCKPCKVIDPHYHTLSATHGDIVFLSVNIDSFEEIAVEYGATRIPLFVKVCNKKEISRIVTSDKLTISDFITTNK